MKNFKSYYYLYRMSKEEIRNFRKFVQAPFNPNNGLHERILDIFESKILGDTEQEISSEEFYTILYPGQAFNQNYFARLMSEFQKLAIDFIAYEAFKNSPKDYYRVLLREFNRSGNDRHFASIHKKAMRYTETMPEDPELFHFRFRLNLEMNEFLTRTKKLKSDYYVPEVLDSLMQDFLLQSLMLGSVALNNDAILNTSYGDNVASIAAEYAKIDYPNLPPLVKCYYLVYQSLLGQDETEAFGKLLVLLDENEGNFSKRELRDLYRYAINFCARQVNSGKTEFMAETQKVIHVVIDRQLFIETGGISPENYKNLVGMLLRIGEIQWAAMVIKDYKTFLPTEFREKAYLFNKAIWHFWNKEYENARNVLKDHLSEFDDPRFGGDARAYLCKCTYYLGEFIELESQLEAFRKYLERKTEILAESSKVYGEFVRGFRQFILAVQDVGTTRQKKLESLLAHLTNSEFGRHQEWLIQTLTEMLAD